MKLSEHGKDMLAAFGFAHRCDEAFDLLDDYEFSPKYFTGAVILTLEEAKTIQRMFDDLIGMHSRGAVRIEAEGFETIYMVKHRIEQAEMSMQST